MELHFGRVWAADLKQSAIWLERTMLVPAVQIRGRRKRLGLQLKFRQ